ncbi:hypothetical protein G6O69_27245 [Pseudenhygromyxa sp. WMMC2535]|uniref:hypothetical protein n=1 Tax=Pseudenhygromyxa sp. WMMC2535 TaxID=2712867 RepID=UPI001551E22C|nr:hypothetical protein [Pseudenhygromyxa sp. WMMC2535]NVB41565.1 hypothetical protein [Pseudenhygromyxa sp. WMMC2535]
MSESPSASRSGIDAAKLILADLDSLQRERRRHFLPALGVILIAVVGGLLLVGLRPDLFDQPWWKLLVQALIWLMCLLVFPAIGLGLIFPSRGARVALAAVVVGLTPLATLGLPGEFSLGDDCTLTGCGMMLTAYALLVMLMGLFSGAFLQRRSASAVFWIAAGVSLTALSAVTWHCPMDETSHILHSHLGVALLLMAATSGVGALVRRRAGKQRDAELGARAAANSAELSDAELSAVDLSDAELSEVELPESDEPDDP